MSEVITGLLKLTFGLILKKLSTYGAEKLQNGDITDQMLRGWILRELDDVKSKLDSISRKDLRTSISKLRKGIERLDKCYDAYDENGNPSTADTPNAGAHSCQKGGPNKSAQQPVSVADAVALANAVGKMKIASSKRFESAKESFKQAENRACDAFHNTALSTEERILASKVRITSGILEHLEDPEFAVTDCLGYLKELNDMQAIQEIFTVDLQGGVKSLFKTDSRTDIVETVTMINLTLADFISKFTKQRMAVFEWPMIKCGKQFVHPIHYNEKSLPNVKDMKITTPWDTIVIREEDRTYNPTLHALNKKGDVVCFSEDKNGLQKLTKTSGRMHPYCLSPSESNTEHSRPKGIIRDLAVDHNDTVYILSHNEKADEYILSVYKTDGRHTYHCLQFLEKHQQYRITATVSDDVTLAIACATKVYLCNSDGQLLNSFDTDLKDHSLELVTVSCKNEIALLTHKGFPWDYPFRRIVNVYTNDGKLQTTVKFPPDKWSGFLFHNHATNSINTASYDREIGGISVKQLSWETGELQRSYLLYHTNFAVPTRQFLLDHTFICHTNGALAMVHEDYGVYLQKPS